MHKFQNAIEGYDRLGDPVHRGRYDANLARARAGVQRVELLSPRRPEPVAARQGVFDEQLRSIGLMQWDL